MGLSHESGREPRSCMWRMRKKDLADHTCCKSLWWHRLMTFGKTYVKVDVASVDGKYVIQQPFGKGVSALGFLEITEDSVAKLRNRRCTLDILYVYLKYQLV